MTSSRRSLADLGFKLLNRLHRFALWVTRGRWPANMRGMAVVELHTIGRRSGLPRASMLTSPLSDEHRIVLVASRGGSDQHPSWYVNLRANPDVDITMHGRRTPWRARTASPEEKAELWPRIIAVYKQYDEYQKKSARDLPVVICEPRPA